MIGNHAPLVAAEDLTRAVSGHLTVLTEAQPARVHDIRAQGGFARDFATVNGQRVMVAALTHQQFADLARTTRLGRTFAFLERLLPADFSTYERAAAVYSATTWGELRDLTGDLPPPTSRTGLPSDTVASRRGPRSTERRLVGQMMIWTFVLPLAAGLAWPFSPVAVWLAMIVISTALLTGMLFDR